MRSSRCKRSGVQPRCMGRHWLSPISHLCVCLCAVAGRGCVCACVACLLCRLTTALTAAYRPAHHGVQLWKLWRCRVGVLSEDARPPHCCFATCPTWICFIWLIMYSNLDKIRVGVRPVPQCVRGSVAAGGGGWRRCTRARVRVRID